MYIPPETIDLVRDRVIIEDVVKRYVPSLTKKGNNYVGLCPFHKEKTPSFTVSSEKRMFHCFGCHTGGNVFIFISKIENISFPESVKFLADSVGIQVNEVNKKDTDKLDAIYGLNKKALDLFVKSLRSGAGKKAESYLINRGITRESIDQFNIGFAPDSWDYLYKHFNTSRNTVALAESIGLINVSVKENKKRFYDKFRNRVIFPIFDINNRVIAFGGRVIDKGEPKYLNSPESEVFKKRNILYGLNWSIETMREVSRAIVVEGYLDVIGCHQAGIKNVVAPLGTALTPDQLKLLSRYCKEVVIIFDADNAGMKAALRSLDISDELNLDVKVGMLPEGDPFDFVQQKGIREFMILVDSAMSPIDFRIGNILKDYDNIGRVNTLLNLFSVIRELKYETERSVYLKKISAQLHLDENSIRADFNHFLQNKKNDKSSLRTVSEKNKKGKESDNYISRSYRDLIKLVCNYPSLIEKAVIDYSEDDFSDSVLRNIFRKISELYYSDQNFSIDKIFDFFNTGSEMDFLNESLNVDYNVQNPSSVYTEIFHNIRVHHIEDKIEKYAAMIKNSGGKNSHEYIVEIEVLRREKEKLTQYIYNKIM